MNLYNGLNKITEYIEEHIDEEISMNTLAHFLGCSIYTMERIFSMLVGLTIKEYIKRRRFTLAIKKLMDGEKIIDVSLFCGYSNPTSFSRKFYDIYKVHPKDIRVKKINFILQPILTFEEKQYNNSVTYRIELTKEKLLYGKKLRIEKNVPKEAEKFWEEMKKEYPKILDSLPRYAFLEEGKESFYWILSSEKEGTLERFIIPKGKWLVFKGNSFKGIDISYLSKRVYKEYLKSLSFKVKNNYTLELYYEDYIEIWIPIN